MKKLISLILAIALSMAFLVGCGEEKTSDPSSQDVSTIASDETPQSEAEKTAYEQGSWIENTYTNESLNITFTPEETWLRATDDEIATIMGFATGAEMKDTMAAQKTIYEFLLNESGGQGNIQFMVEDLSAKLGGTLVDEDQYLEIMKAQFAQSDPTAKMGTIATRTIAGETYKVLPVTMTGGVQQEYIVRKLDSHMLAFIATFNAEGKATIDGLFDGIKTIA